MQDKRLTTVVFNDTTKDAIPTGIPHLPLDMLVSITSYLSMEDVTNLYITNKQLLSLRDEVMPSVLREKDTEYVSMVFSRLIVSGNVNDMNCGLKMIPGFKIPAVTTTTTTTPRSSKDN